MKTIKQILVVDDDPNLLKTLGDILKIKGYAVTAAASGAEAIAAAQRVGVNVALIDLKLPDMTGIEVMEQIKSASPHTEAIILTGNASLNTAIEAINKGAYAYLLKPYEIENLLLHIRHASERQQASAEIRRLASFPRLNPMPVIEIAPSGEVSYANPAADKLFPDLRLLDGQHPLLIDLGDIYATFRKNGQTEMMREVTIGEASYEKHIYYVPESELVRITVEDVTERKRTEESLRKLSQAVEQSPSAIAITDLKANIEYVNEGFVKITGYSRAELIGKNPRLLHSGKTPKASYEEMWAHLTRGEIWKGEFINRRKDGSEYIDAMLISPVRQPDGRVTHYLAIKDDITERKRMEAMVLQLNEELENKVAARTADLEQAKLEAEHANRTKSEFLATMSHEIRTPMNGVIGMVDVLQQSGLNESQRETLNVIHDSAFSLLAIIDEILDFSRIEAGKLEINSVPMSVAEVVESACKTMNHMASKNNVELTRYTAPDIPETVMGDPGRLRQILVNLTNNAIKFSSGQMRPGKVSVRAMLAENGLPESTPDQACLEPGRKVKLEFCVTDNGIGIDKEIQARLFTPFLQADSTTTRKYGGTGLGLAISRQLVNIMGGEIRVQSEPGLGSTFTVHLSFALPSNQSDTDAVHHATEWAKQSDLESISSGAGATSSQLSREEARHQGRLILIAEDNEINQKVILQQLKLLGQTADIAGNGREALEQWQSGDYGLLLTDLHMPEMDGYGLTAAIRAAENLVNESCTSETGKKHATIIAITANALKGEAEHCHDVGMDDYLSKPVQLANLKLMLEKWLPTEVVGRVTPASVATMAGVTRPTKPSTTSESIPVDVNVLKKLIGDDEETLRELLQDFRISAAKIAAELRTVCAAGNTAAVAAAAHKLKSSARSVGALALGELCAEMEQAGKAGQVEALAALLPRFEAEIVAVDEYLKLRR